MEPDLTQERQQAHALLDMLSADKLNAVRSLLEVMVEPLARSLALAPWEDEEITRRRQRHWIALALPSLGEKVLRTKRSGPSSV
jgi:hypothetical protein